MEMDSLSDVRGQRVPEVRMAEGSLKGTKKFTVETKYIFAIIVQSCCALVCYEQIKMGTIQGKVVPRCVCVVR